MPNFNKNTNNTENCLEYIENTKLKADSSNKSVYLQFMHESQIQVPQPAQTNTDFGIICWIILVLKCETVWSVINGSMEETHDGTENLSTTNHSSAQTEFILRSYKNRTVA